jgi:hypothetical protein
MSRRCTIRGSIYNFPPAVCDVELAICDRFRALPENDIRKTPSCLYDSWQTQMDDRCATEELCAT